MKKTSFLVISWSITLIFLSILTYFFRSDLINLKSGLFQSYLPCQKPITYEIGKFDQRFGMSQKNFLAVLAVAEGIWEKPSGLNLFQYAPSGTLKINLIYDYRQDATVKLRELGIVVKDDKATYDKIKNDFTVLQKSYLTDKSDLENQITELDRLNVAYNQEIELLNRRGGATPAEARRLDIERGQLDQMYSDLKVQQNLLNDKVDKLNALADALNQLAHTLNLTVDKYNTIGATQGREFEEGTYTSSATGQEIDIYQYSDSTKLVRVLAHELGHALNLPHVTSTKAIMYYLNSGVNEKLAPADLLLLQQHCNIK